MNFFFTTTVVSYHLIALSLNQLVLSLSFIIEHNAIGYTYDVIGIKHMAVCLAARFIRQDFSWTLNSI